MSKHFFKGQLLILNYHAISSEQNSTNLYTITPDSFKAQLQVLAEAQVPILNLKTFETKEADADFAVAITFDDSNASDYTIALPFIEEMGFDASFFILTGSLGKPGKLDINQIKNLHEKGFHIGSHGTQHELMTRMDALTQFNELKESKQVLETLLQVPIQDFAFAYGQFDEPLLNHAKACSYTRCFSTGMRLNSCDPMPFVLYRWNITNKIAYSNFEQVIRAKGKLSPAFDLQSRLNTNPSESKKE